MKKCIYPVLVAFVAVCNLAAAAGDPEAGQTKSAACTACHGADGSTSLLPVYPKLAGMGEKYLTKQLQDVKSGERTIAEMTPVVAAMSDEDFADIAAFYAAQTPSLAGAKSEEASLIDGSKIDSLVLGEAIFRHGNPNTGVPACAGCHSPTGKGNAPAGYPRLSGQNPDYVTKQLKAFRIGERANDGEAMVMRQVAEHMSDSELAAVANYIAGLH